MAFNLHPNALRQLRIPLQGKNYDHPMLSLVITRRALIKTVDTTVEEGGKKVVKRARRRTHLDPALVQSCGYDARTRQTSEGETIALTPVRREVYVSILHGRHNVVPVEMRTGHALFAALPAQVLEIVTNPRFDLVEVADHDPMRPESLVPLSGEATSSYDGSEKLGEATYYEKRRYSRLLLEDLLDAIKTKKEGTVRHPLTSVMANPGFLFTLGYRENPDEQFEVTHVLYVPNLSRIPGGKLYKRGYIFGVDVCAQLEKFEAVIRLNFTFDLPYISPETQKKAEEEFTKKQNASRKARVPRRNVGMRARA